MSCHKERSQDLRKIPRENSSTVEPDDHVIVCADSLRCMTPGCHRQASPLCSAFFCSEHHIEICHKLPEAEAQLECCMKR